MANLNIGDNLDFLSDEATFIEALCKDSSGGCVQFDPWQRADVRRSDTFSITRKSRRVGYSWKEAAKGLARAMLRPKYEKFFVSISLDESKEKISAANEFYELLPDRFKLKRISAAKTEIAFEDKHGRISRIKAMTSRAPRGYGGDINLDEAAFIANGKEIYNASLYLIALGNNELSIGSSPGPQSGMFYDVFTDRAKYPEFKRYTIPWWLCERLCTDTLSASIEAPKLITEERVARFGTARLRSIFANSTLEGFQQEAECLFVDEATAYMPFELIMGCEVAKFGIDNKAALDEEGLECVDLMCYIATGDAKLREFCQFIRDNKRGLVEIGYDVGRKHDKSEMIVTDEVKGVKEIIGMLTLDKQPFPVQKHVIDVAMKVIQPYAFRLDATGMGMQLGEECASQYGSSFEAITFTNQGKALMATAIKKRLETRTIRIPATADLRDQLHSIKRTLTTSNNFVYEADSNKHHGDKVWALGLTELRGANVKPSMTSAGFGRNRRITVTTPLDY
jgi:phage FluMu gp28-like protein